MLTEEELNRYSRQTNLAEFGIEGQEKLKGTKVLVVGAGGLGCPAMLYLAAAGIGELGIIDFDKVEESNLHRQILYSNKDVGNYKASSAASYISEKYPYTSVKYFNEQLSTSNAKKLISEYDIVLDGTDNFSTRYLINDACVILNKPFVFASLYKFQLQVSVFNYMNGPTYRCLFPTPPANNEMPNCTEAGVIGVLPGIAGCLQANETIKIATGIGEPLSGKLLVFDGLTMTQQILLFDSLPENKNIQSLGSYKIECNSNGEINEIVPEELNKLIKAGADLEIIDVREKDEYEKCNLGGTLIPLTEIENKWKAINKDKQIIVHCHHGGRSRKAIQLLNELGEFKNIYNLKGGIHAWAKEIDPLMKTY